MNADRNIGIIGAGVTGLTAAYDLTKRGHHVTVYEARPYAGGLAAGFRDASWDWHLERFYHHWFASDDDVIDLIGELGAEDKLFFPRPTTSIYHQGRIYPFDSPLRVLQFTPLSLIDRLRVGLATLYLRLVRRWKPLEGVTAASWIRRVYGERAYRILWEPLLISKFGRAHYQDVNMAWFWARIHKRTSRLGYFVGGFQAFIDLLAERVETQGGEIRFNAHVRAVHPAEGGLRLTFREGDVVHERVIATCSPQMMREIAPELPTDYASQLTALESMGAAVLVLALDRQLTEGHYWINLPKGDEIPFMGLVEHTNYVSPEHYGGDHLVYCGDYLPPDHPYFDYSKEQLLEAYLPGLVKINPDFGPDWIRESWMFTERYAQPVPLLHHSRTIPPLKTPIPGLWMANMSQVYPWDRGTNYAVAMGRRVAQAVG
jgi:protoporphyrinogen oxidase